MRKKKSVRSSNIFPLMNIEYELRSVHPTFEMFFSSVNKKMCRNVGLQMGGSNFKDVGTQVGESRGSYQRDNSNGRHNVWNYMSAFVTYHDLLTDVLMTKELCIKWLMTEKLIAST